ncbi:TolC family protein [Gracilimonas sediminicola]|uniref:TolC family protein n=1 Tax=Gracilimonas sediminicola TaxID=2952158 RepID=A0A9X2RDM5_9BACT|nr:TolC family protein [Gracilimonas sediminicola]MCP9290562.1 TolC family protein [Gracilimonas sediminicola]
MRYNQIVTSIITSFALALIILIPEVSHGQSLDEYLIIAGENNPTLKTEFTKYRASLEQVPQVTALPDPDLSFGYFISPIETRVGPQQSRIGLNQMFPWFGTLSAKGDVATELAKSQFEVFEEARNKLFFQVKQQWYKLYLLHQSIDILEENIDILQTFENLSLQRYETGQVSQVDVLRVQIEKEDLQVQLELLKDQLKTNEIAFNELLNQDKSSPVKVSDRLALTPFTVNEVELSQQILSRNPRLSKLDYQALSAQRSIDVAQKSGMPKFGVGFDYIFTDERTDMNPSGNGDDAFMVKLGVKIPLWRGKYQAQEKQAKLNYRSIQDQQQAVENSLKTDLEKALTDLKDAERRNKLYKDIQIRRARQAIDILLEEYTSSSADFEELLRLQQKLLKFQLAQEQSIADQNTAVAYLEYLSGSYNTTPEQMNVKN